MKKPLLLAFAAALGLQVNAQTFTPITLTGFTADVIANGTGPALNSTSTDVDGGSNNFVSQDYKTPANQSPTTFLPANGTISSATTPGLTFQLAPYTGFNSLKLFNTSGTKALTFATPIASDLIYVLVTSAYGCTFTATITFTDGSTQAFAGNTISDWNGSGSNVAIQGISRVNRNTDVIDNNASNPRLYQVSLTPSAANATKLIQSIKFQKTSLPGSEILHVLGITTKATLVNDVFVTAISSLNSPCGLTSQENVCVTIRNNGTAPQTSIPVKYSINGGPFITETYTGTLAPGATTNYCFAAKANLSVPGTYPIQACTALAGDQATNNDCFSRTVSSIPSVSTFPYLENFETSNGGWEAGGVASSWGWGAPSKAVITSAASGTKAWVTNLTGNYNGSENSQVISPCFNFSSLVQPIIEMKAWWQTEFSNDGAVLQSSIDGGATWQNVGVKGDPNNWFNDNSINGAPGGQTAAIAQGWSGRISTSNGSAGWVTAKHTLTGLGGLSGVRLRIAFGSDGNTQDDGFAFDDIQIYETAAIDGGVTAINGLSSGCGLTTQETITISIKNFGISPLTNIPVSYTVDGGAPVNEVMAGPIAPGATATFTFAGKANLSAIGQHTIVATTNISNDAIAANNATTLIINTIPIISTLPYMEGFENGDGGWMAGGTNASWALGTPAKNVINSAATGTKAWTTSLAGSYNINEKSYVVGPCFNFAGKTDPDFEMKAWWNSEFSVDGAVLQSSIDGGATWQNVGAMGDPANWYNDNTINGGPGNQPAASAQGWTGRNSSGDGSGGWKIVRHKLNGLGGQSSVLLRVAFGSDGLVVDNGFAFDDIRIGDNTNNLAVNSITPINKVCGFGANETIQAVIENVGATPVTGFTMAYTINGGTPVTQTYTGTLAGGAIATFTFSQGANLSAPGPFTIVVTVTMPGDPVAANNSATYSENNTVFAGLPVFDFEPAGTGLAQMQKVTKSRSAIVENVVASNGLNSTKGLVMDGVNHVSWTVPVGLTDPWTSNVENYAVAYICFNPSGGNPNDPLWLSFDLKQLFKTANANTNFRVTVNGTPIGGNTVNNVPANTYRPPFSGSPINWERINLDLSAYKHLNGVQIALESNVKEPFANGTGTANLIDNITISRTLVGVKENTLTSQLHVLPNPSTGNFLVSLPQGKTYQLEVTDLSGKKIFSQQAKGDSQLNLEGIAKGIYLLKVSSENGTAVRKLIVE